MLVRGARARGGRCSPTGLADYGVPVAPAARVPLRRTRLGAGVLAFARAALPGGTAGDVLDLAAHARQARRPGRRRRAGGAAAPRRGRDGGRRGRRGSWEPAIRRRRSTRSPRPRPVRAFLDGAAGRGRGDLDRAAPRAAAAVLGPEDAADARVAGALRSAAQELRSLAAADPELLGDAGRAARRARRRRGARDAGGRAACWSPTRWRSARAASAPCSCAGCRTASSRAARSPSRSSTTTSGAALARASGLVLRRCTRTCSGEERYLFYACVSRPEEVLFLSFRSSDEEGDPAQPSPFVDDVRALFTDELWEQRGRAAAGRGHVAAGARRRRRTSCGARRAAAERVAGARRRSARPATAAVRDAARRARRGAGARALETFAACGVRWLVESVLKPERGRARPGADAPRLGRPRRARADAAAAARAHGLGAAGAGDAAGRAGGAARRARRAARLGPRRRPRRRGAARARGGPRALPPPRGGDGRRAGAGVVRVELRRQRGRARPARARRGRPRRHRPRRPDRRRRRGRTRVVRDYKGKTRARRRRAGRRTAASRPRCTRSRRASCSGSTSPARSTSRSARSDCRPRGMVAQGIPGRYVERRRGRARRAGRGARRGPRARGRRDRASMHAGAVAPVPVALLAERLRLPGDLPRGGRTGASAAAHDAARVHARAAGGGRRPHAARRCWPPTPARARPR